MSNDKGVMTPNGIIFGPTKLGKLYLCSKKHRMEGNPHKTVWVITHLEEYLIFSDADNGNWKDEKGNYWGIQKGFGIIGKQKIIKFHIAKFIGPQNSHEEWHGYPELNTRNRPSDAIINQWENIGYINKPLADRIKEGKAV